MINDDRDLFTKLLFNHKHLWIEFQVLKHLKEFPQDDPEKVQERFCAAAYELYHPLEEALLAGQPLQDALQTVLLGSDLAQIEGRQQW